jgi:hypothetical protein
VEHGKPVTDQELVRAAILKSGLSIRQFSKRIIGREDRTTRRWLAGQPVPKAARAFLEAYLKKRRPRKKDPLAYSPETYEREYGDPE